MRGTLLALALLLCLGARGTAAAFDQTATSTATTTDTQADVGGADPDIDVEFQGDGLPPSPTNLSEYYSAKPAPIGVGMYLKALFKCKGAFSLCAYATCVPVADSDPPIAECGCYEFDDINIGFSPGILNRAVKARTLFECNGRRGECLTTNFNKAFFCKKMENGTMFPGYPLVSTYNPNSWVLATNQTDDPPPGYYNAKVCEGGTFANCFGAACVRGAPTSPYLPAGSPTYNSTCYCPFVTTLRNFSMSSEDYPCGPKDPKEVVPELLIYNGA